MKAISFIMFKISGRSSVVERLVANEKVEGSIPLPAPKNIMTNLFDKKCVPCEGGVTPFDISEIQISKKVDGWNIIEMKKRYFF